MDNSQFLSYFWDLTDEHTNEQIVTAAESIVNLVESKQKLENTGKEYSVAKYKMYLNICENPTEDILYTTKRLIGGIASTGVNARRGFALTFSLLVEKFSNILNFTELIGIIEKETIVSKGEKGHIKNCVLTGKILMLQTLLSVSSLSSENYLTIFKNLFDLIQNKILEEAILQILNNFFKKVKEAYYVELQEKKLNKFFDKFLTLVGKILPNKTNFGNLKSLFEYSLIFCLLSFTDTFSSINNFLHHNTIPNILTENSLVNYFKLLLSQNIREGEFHSSFKFFFNFLANLNDFTKVIEVWNVLIDSNVQDRLKIVSLKNFQFLIYSVSKFLLEKYFVLKYIKQIFDSSYFDTLMKFTSNKKFKYIHSLVETLMTQMKKSTDDSEENRELTSSYSYDLLAVFNGEGGLSPQTYKSFYAFLFKNLNEDIKLEYIEKLTRVEADGEEANEEDFLFRIAAVRTLMTSTDGNLSKTLKKVVLQFFLREYFSSEQRNDVEVADIIEDRLLVVIFSYMRVPKEETESKENNKDESIKPIKDKKMIKLLMQIHKFLQGLYTSNVLEDLEMEDYKVYLKFYKKFALLVSNLIKESTQSEEEKPQNDKLFSIVKIAMVALILFLKNPNEYTDIITDLYQISKFKSDWQKVYMDLLISLLHKGNNTLSEFIMNCFRKISKYLDFESFEVLLGFLSQGSDDKEVFEDFEDDVEMNENLSEDQKEDTKEPTKEITKVKSKKKSSGKKQNGKMFADLVQINEDVEMASI